MGGTVVKIAPNRISAAVGVGLLAWIASATEVRAQGLVLSEFNGGVQGVTVTFGSWVGNISVGTDFITVDATEAGTLINNLALGGNSVKAPATPEQAIRVSLRSLPGNTARRVHIVLTDGDGTTGGWNFDIPASSSDLAWSLLVKKLTPEYVEAPGLIPGFDQTNIARWELRGDIGSNAPLRLQFEDLRIMPAKSAISGQFIQGAGAAPADIQAAVDQYRTLLGTNNGAVGQTFPDGRREINWDAVPDNLAAPNELPPNQFAARGAVFFTPGSGFQVSANLGAGPIEFDNLRPDASSKFAPFSPQRLFTSLDSNVTETLFFVAGTSRPASTNGFGAVFTNLTERGAAVIEFLDSSGAMLFRGTAPPANGNETLSFLGVKFDSNQVYLVRITSGDVVLNQTKSKPEYGQKEVANLVVMDDFIYGEPQPIQ
jgi:hypothetical protein